MGRSRRDNTRKYMIDLEHRFADEKQIDGARLDRQLQAIIDRLNGFVTDNQSTISITRRRVDYIAEVLPNYVLQSRGIYTDAPVEGGGDLTEDRTISVRTATSTLSGVVAGMSTTTSSTATSDDDYRLSDARDPTQHNHSQSDVTGLTDSLSLKVDNTVQVIAVAPITGGGDLSESRTFSMTRASTTEDGYLHKDDFVAFNAGGGGGGSINEIAVVAPIAGGGTTSTVTLSMTVAASGQDGYLSGSDWIAFDGKEPALTKGNLTATSPILLDQTRQVIGGAAVISLSASYMPREKLLAARTYYVRTDGNDANDGLTNSAGGAFLTWQQAVNVAASLDFNGYQVTLKSGNTGTFTAGANLTGIRPQPGAGGLAKLIIEGDTATPTNVLMSVTGGTCFWVDGSIVEIKGLELRTTTSGYGIYATNMASVEFSVLNFGATAQAHIQAYAGSRVRATGNYTISGGAVFHWLAQLAGIIEVSGRTVTITGTPNFSWVFTLVNNCAQVICNGMTFVGSATGTRHQISANGIVNTAGGGAAYLPGDVAGGTPTTGGQYL